MTQLQVCEFCAELRQTGESRFHRIYAGCLDSRVIVRSASFVVFPTIGQLFRGSVLIVPRKHTETLATLDVSRLKELEHVLSFVENKVSSMGVPFVYEHGARLCTSSGCGVYHAHLH